MTTFIYKTYIDKVELILTINGITSFKGLFDNQGEAQRKAHSLVKERSLNPEYAEHFDNLNKYYHE